MNNDDKKFETPMAELVYFDDVITTSELKDPNLPPDGWIN